MDRWHGKVAIVTGASVGIGAAIALALAQHGMKVVGLARRKELVEALAKKVAPKTGKIMAVKADVTKEEEILRAFKWTLENVGAVNVLINNTGVLYDSPMLTGDTKLWKNTIDVNLLSYCIATREAIKQMREAKIDGHIIFINSILGHFVPNLPLFNVYIASKYAVTAVCQTLRVELDQIKSKIKISDLSPGVVATEIAKSSKKVIDHYEGKSALTSKDVADALIYILGTPPNVVVHELILQPTLPLM